VARPSFFFFLPLDPVQIEADHLDVAPLAPSGGMHKGGSAERFETPLWGELAASMGASAFCWRAACQRRGGNPPAPAFPRRGKRERGSSDFLAAAGSSSWRGAAGRHAAGRVCARSATTFPSRIPDHQTYMLIRLIRFPEVLPAPTPYPASIRTLNRSSFA